MHKLSLYIVLLVLSSQLMAQYSPAAGKSGSDAVHADSTLVISWASKVRIVPGYINIANVEAGKVEFADSSLVLAKADNRTVSLGDGGVAILGFPVPISNNYGHDFAIYENSFDGNFLELARVEVSSDSIRWVEFPSVSLTSTLNQVDGFGHLDPEKIHNLAGKYISYYGTPFDLQDIADSMGINLNQIKYIRISDIVGSIDENYRTKDSQGNIINDPWPTPFSTSGFDLDAVAVLGTSTTTSLFPEKYIKLWPNPTSDYINISGLEDAVNNLEIISSSGVLYLKHITNDYPLKISVYDLKPGIYYIRIPGYRIRRFSFIKH